MPQRALVCPQCAANIDVPEDYFRESIQCPSCGLQVSRRTNAGPALQQIQPQQPQVPRPMPRRAPRPMHAQPAQYAQQPQYGVPAASPYPAQYAAQRPQYAPSPYSAPRGNNKRLLWLLLIPLGLIVIIGITVIPFVVSPTSNVDEWTLHRSAAGRYEIRMPREPEETSEPMWTELGTRQIHTASVVSGLRNYEVTWFDLGTGSEDQYYYDYEAGADAIAEALNGTVNSLETVTVSGHDARLLRISASAGGSNGMYYMLRAGNRVYFVGAANIDLSDAAMIRRYMDTFRITG